MIKKPTEILEHEHHIIQKVVGVMAALVAQVAEGGKDIKSDTIRDIVEFMRIFADKCHHGKEETHMFPFLIGKGVPETGCPIGILIHEHEKSRSLVKQLSEAGISYSKGDIPSKDPLIKCLQGLVDLYPNHIWKEEYLLFPMTNKILTDKDQKELSGKFETVEKEMGHDIHERFEKMAEDLTSEF